MRSEAEYQEALRWVSWGLNDCGVSRMTGIPRGTVREWRRSLGNPFGTRVEYPGQAARERKPRSANDCPRCADGRLDKDSYAYLLGVYLGGRIHRAQGQGHLRHAPVPGRSLRESHLRMDRSSSLDAPTRPHEGGSEKDRRLRAAHRYVETLALSVPSAWAGSEARSSDRPHAVAARDRRTEAAAPHTRLDPIGRVARLEPRSEASVRVHPLPVLEHV